MRPDRDAAGRVADFHALRHTHISQLVAHGEDGFAGDEAGRSAVRERYHIRLVAEMQPVGGDGNRRTILRRLPRRCRRAAGRGSPCRPQEQIPRALLPHPAGDYPRPRRLHARPGRTGRTDRRRHHAAPFPDRVCRATERATRPRARGRSGCRPAAPRRGCRCAHRTPKGNRSG